MAQEIKMENDVVLLKEIQPFADKLEDISSKEELVWYRLRLQDAKSQVQIVIDELDKILVQKMKESDTKEMEIADYKVFLQKEKKETIKDTRVLVKMLTSDNEAERELSRRALSGGQSAWKISQVRLLQDTLGLDLIETNWGDKIKVQMVDKKFLTQA